MSKRASEGGLKRRSARARRGSERPTTTTDRIIRARYSNVGFISIGPAQRSAIRCRHLASHLPQPGGHGQERTRAGSFGLRRTGAAFSSRRPLRQVFKVAKGLTCHRSNYSYRSGLWKVLNISTRRLEVGSRESERWGWFSFLFCGSSEFSGCWFWRA